MHKDRKVAVILLIFSVFVFVTGAKIPAASLGEGPGPGAFPMFLAIVLAGLSISLWITAGRKKKKEEPKEAAKALDEIQKIDEPVRDKVRRVVTCVGLLAAYFLVLPVTGFIGSTILFSFGFLMFLYKVEVKKCVVPAIAISAFAFVLFEMGLSVPLPAFMEIFK